MAMVQGAVYDAVAIDQTHRPYLLTRRFDQLASQEAAAATAAFRVLTLTFPEQLPNLQPLYDVAGRRARGAGQGERIAAGIAAADAMLAQGTIAARFSPACGAPIRAIGGRCSRPMEVRSAISPWIASGLPFLLESPSQFRTDGPATSPAPPYAEEFNEVKELGALEARSGRRSRPTSRCS